MVGAAAPRPQAPGRYLRDHLAAQLTRAPGHRHTWGRKAGRKGTGLCVAIPQSGHYPNTRGSLNHAELLTLRGDPVLVGTARQAAVVWVQPSDMAGAITAWCRTLDLTFFSS